MRTFTLVALSLVLSASAVSAQTVNTKWHCPKAADHSYDVGDAPGHAYMITQGTCTATTSDAGFAEKSGTFTEFDEVWKTSTAARGRYNVTMESGDKVFYTYDGTSPSDPTKAFTNKWKIVSGTGKMKGVKGSGGCTGTNNSDGSADLVCTGTVSMAK